MKALKHGLISWICVLVLAACTEVLSLQRIQIEKAEQMLQRNAEGAIALLRSVKVAGTVCAGYGTSPL